MTKNDIMCNNQLGGALITQNLLGEWLISNKNRHIAVSVLVLVLIVAFANISGCKNNGGNRDKFPQPEKRKSQNGVLKTFLEAIIAVNFIGNNDTGEIDEVETLTFEGSLIGPTFRVKPGDTI
ncbi:MAG: hypothetical protein IH964_12685 [Candidatus Dadabacteria bacterium]|nr:hypothetical protein [Candidatus Dadabacteria bacterium]